MYEYLLHVGAQKSAQTFLSEVRRHAALSLSLRAPLEELGRVAFPLKGGLTLAHSIQEV